MLADRSDATEPMAGLPYLTGDIEPIGGVIKQRHHDFLVEEIPLYQPCGEGEHIYLLIEKAGMPTSEAVREVARHFGVERRAVGYAGMKDKHAVTRQVMSVHTPGRVISDFPELRHERMRVLWADMHTNKLRIGHLRGNRFSIRIRDVKVTDVVCANRVIRRLQQTGVPNYIGMQRFGMRQNNHLMGLLELMEDDQALLDLLLGPDEQYPEMNTHARKCYASGNLAEALEAYPAKARAEREALRVLVRGRSAKEAVRAIQRDQRGFWVSALQSWMFNQIVARRLSAEQLGMLREGDVAFKHDNGAMFMVTSGSAEDETLATRLARFEISPTGPLWGAKMMRARGETDAMELAVLEEAGVTETQLQRVTKRIGPFLGGSRRALRVPLIDPEVEGGVDEHGAYVRCAFELPRGSFATIVMREIMKSESAGVDDEEET